MILTQDILDGKLRLLRLRDPHWFGSIPRRLFEQVRDADYDIDQIYRFGPDAVKHPCTIVYVIIDPKEPSLVRGVLWMQLNLYTQQLEVNVLSVNKEYQGNGLMPALTDFLRDFIKHEHLSGVVKMRTKRPEAFAHYGWRKVATEMMLNCEVEQSDG